MKRSILFLLVLALVAGGCDDNTTDSSTDTGTGTTGTVVGYIWLTDELGNPVSDRSGVLIRIKDPEITAITNSDGRFELKNVPAGVYDGELSKDGYAPTSTGPFQFVGVDTLPLPNSPGLYAIAGQRTFTLTQPVVETQGNRTDIKFIASVDPQGTPTEYRITVAKEPGAAIDNQSSYVTLLGPQEQVDDTLTIRYRDSYFRAVSGLQPGDRAYLITWTTNSVGMANGLRSNEVSFVVP